MTHTFGRREKRLIPPLAIALLVGGAIGAAVDHHTFADQPGGGIKRTILQRIDDPGNARYEAVMGIAELAPGASSGKHRHPGIELSYVLSGSVSLQRAEGPPVTYTAGEAFRNEGGVHDARNTGSTPAKVLAVYLVQKGKPLAEAVP